MNWARVVKALFNEAQRRLDKIDELYAEGRGELGVSLYCPSQGEIERINRWNKEAEWLTVAARILDAGVEEEVISK